MIGGGIDRAHALGILLVLASAVAFSVAGVLTRIVDADAWTVTCWRGFFGAPLIAAYVIARDPAHRIGAVLSLGWRGWFLATFGSLCSIAFIASFKLTYVANVSLIYATVPFAAAALGWLLLRERVRLSTMLAAVGALIGVAVMLWGGIGQGHLAGDLLAVVMTVGMAAYMVLIRVFRTGAVVSALAVSSLQLFAAGWLFGDPLGVSLRDLAWLAAFGVAFALAAILLTEGTRLIPAAEAGFLGTFEAPLAPVLAWLVLAELPPATTMVGGAIVLVVILVHAARDLRANARPPDAPAAAG